jgi:ATP-dependent exoDNAse (exonuclease V) beta subunit
METSQIHGGDIFDFNLLRHHSAAQRPMAEIALDVGANKVVLTTMHKSKGREFDYVILPAIDPKGR